MATKKQISKRNTAATGQYGKKHLYIAEAFESLGLSDEKVGDRIGVSRVTVWRWRNEQWRLDPDKIARIAAAIGKKPQDLWYPPERESIDAMLDDQNDELRDTAADIVRRLLPKRP